MQFHCNWMISVIHLHARYSRFILNSHKRFYSISYMWETVYTVYVRLTKPSKTYCWSLFNSSISCIFGLWTFRPFDVSPINCTFLPLTFWNETPSKGAKRPVTVCLCFCHFVFEVVVDCLWNFWRIFYVFDKHWLLLQSFCYVSYMLQYPCLFVCMIFAVSDNVMC